MHVVRSGVVIRSPERKGAFMSPPSLIDVHCHLAAPEFDADRAEVIERAREAGVVAVVVVGEDYDDNLRVLEAAAAFPSFIRPALGHHPWRMDRAAADVPRTLRLLEEHRDAVVAIGEVGLDYRVAETDEARAEQRAVLAEFIEASRVLDLPLSVHVRSAGHYVIELLLERGARRAALHAFDGKARYALAGAAAGYLFSMPATVLVSEQKQKLARALPLEALLLESDAPALGPERGARNEPAVLARSLARIAAIRGGDEQTIAAAATRNALRLFGPRLEPGQ
jgi:TatD DNase family protein